MFGAFGTSTCLGQFSQYLHYLVIIVLRPGGVIWCHEFKVNIGSGDGTKSYPEPLITRQTHWSISQCNLFHLLFRPQSVNFLLAVICSSQHPWSWRGRLQGGRSHCIYEEFGASLLSFLQDAPLSKFNSWVNIGSVNGLMPDGTKPLLEPMLTYDKYGPMAFIWGHYHKI